MIHIRFQIGTLEDLHIGDGLNKAGLYDDGTTKDKIDGKWLPEINSETFKGILRQSLLESCNFAEDSKQQCYSDLYREIFSYSNQASLDIIILPESKKTPGKIWEDPFTINTYTAVDKKARKAESRSLRSIECVRKGFVFTGDLYFANPNEAKRGTLIEFLKQGLLNIKWLGSNRRRGLGAVEISILDTVDSYNITNVKNMQQMKELVLIVKTEDDVTIAGAGQSGNHFKTLDYIPGTSFLGSLRVALGRYASPCLELLEDDKCTISNFLPLPCDFNVENQFNSEIFPFITPIPYSARRKKSSEIYTGIDKDLPYWVYEQEDNHYLNNILSQDQSNSENIYKENNKSFSGGYIIYDQNQWLYYKPSLGLKMRNSINPATQSVEVESGLFSQDCIPKGTYFIGKLCFLTAEEANNMKENLTAFFNDKYFLHIGRGSKPLSAYAIYPATKKTEYLQRTFPNKFTLTCISDVISLNTDLSYSSTIPASYLEKELNLSQGTLTLKKSYAGIRKIHSFSGLAGIRRFAVTAITAGSTFVYSYTGNSDIASKLENIAQKGIGIRRNEGFGNIAFNINLHYNSEDAKQITFKLISHHSNLAEKYNILYHEASNIITTNNIKRTNQSKKLFHLLSSKNDPRIIYLWLKNGADKEKGHDKPFTNLKDVFERVTGIDSYSIERINEEQEKKIESFTLALNLLLDEEKQNEKDSV